MRTKVSGRRDADVFSDDDELRLTGNQIKLERRPPDNSGRTSSRCALLGGGILRPFTAVPLLNLNCDEFDFSDDSARPASTADFPMGVGCLDTATTDGKASGRMGVQEKIDLNRHLRSTELFKNLLAEPVHSWKNGTRYIPSERETQNFLSKVQFKPPENLDAKENHSSSRTSEPIESNTSKVDSNRENQPKPDENEPRNSIVDDINRKGQLIPGLKTKPPLPPRNPESSINKSPSSRSDVSRKDNLERTLASLENCDFLGPVHITVRGETNAFDNEGFVNDDDPPSLSSSTLESVDFKLQNWIKDQELAGNDLASKELNTDISLRELKLQNLASTTEDLEEYKPNKPAKNFIKENIKASSRRKKPQSQTEESSKTKKFTPAQIRAPPDIVINDVPEVDSWMFSEDTKVRKSEMCRTVSYLDCLNTLAELDDREKGRTRCEEIPVRDKVEDGEDERSESTCDEITAILKVLEEENKRAHQNMESIKEIVNSELRETRRSDDSSSGVSNAATSSSSTSIETLVMEDDSKSNNLKRALSFFEIKELDDRRDLTRSAFNSCSNLNDIFTFLDEVDKNCAKSLACAKERVQCATQLTDSIMPLDTIPRFEDLSNRPQQELSHQIIDLHLRIKEKSSAIATLQKELSSLRKQITRMTKETGDVIKQKLRSQKEEHEVVVRRHQKFIDQLIADKKTLNQQCESLLHEMKVLEDRFNSNVKALDHRHRVELQKVRDMQTAAEKMRKERWIDDKTKKIKEMTIKGLEPEIDKMAARHQQELTEMRTYHKRELEELDMRHARKMQQQSEALREQFTVEREKALVQERDVLRQRYEKMVESEEHNYQEQRRKLIAEHGVRMAECERREGESLSERDRAIKTAQSDFEDKLQTALRRHNNELTLLKEKTELEMEAFRNSYKKQSGLQLAEKEAQIRERCKRERDKEIEAVIERLESEAEDAKTQLEQSSENRIKRLKEKYETEIGDVEQLGKETAAKYADAKNKLLRAEDETINLKVTVKQLEGHLNEAKLKLDQLTGERARMKEVLQEETKLELQVLKRELAELKGEKEREMQQVYSRVKLAVARKDEALSELSRENVSLQDKCAYLENMLEQQRKEYLIKQ